MTLPRFAQHQCMSIDLVAVAGLAFILFLLIGREVPLSALGTPIVLLVGGIAAFIRDLRGLAEDRRNMAHLARRWMVSAYPHARQPEHPRNGYFTLSDEVRVGTSLLV